MHARVCMHTQSQERQHACILYYACNVCGERQVLRYNWYFWLKHNLWEQDTQKECDSFLRKRRRGSGQGAAAITWVCVCVCARTLRIVSRDKILHFKKILCCTTEAIKTTSTLSEICSSQTFVGQRKLPKPQVHFWKSAIVKTWLDKRSYQNHKYTFENLLQPELSEQQKLPKPLQVHFWKSAAATALLDNRIYQNHKYTFEKLLQPQLCWTTESTKITSTLLKSCCSLNFVEQQKIPKPQVRCFLKVLSAWVHYDQGPHTWQHTGSISSFLNHISFS